MFSLSRTTCLGFGGLELALPLLSLFILLTTILLGQRKARVTRLFHLTIQQSKHYNMLEDALILRTHLAMIFRIYL